MFNLGLQCKEDSVIRKPAFYPFAKRSAARLGLGIQAVLAGSLLSSIVYQRRTVILREGDEGKVIWKRLEKYSMLYIASKTLFWVDRARS